MLTARYGVDGGRLVGGGVMFMLWVMRSGLVIMLVAQFGKGITLFSGRMFGLVGCRLGSGSAGYMT